MRTKKNRDTISDKAAAIADNLGITQPLPDDPEAFLRMVMKGEVTQVMSEPRLMVDAAKALLTAKTKRESMHSIRKNQGIGKKEALAEAAQQVLGGGDKPSAWSNLLKTTQIN